MSDIEVSLNRRENVFLHKTRIESICFIFCYSLQVWLPEKKAIREWQESTVGVFNYLGKVKSSPPMYAAADVIGAIVLKSFC